MAEYEPPGIREELAVGALRLAIVCQEAIDAMRDLIAAGAFGEAETEETP